MRTCKVKPSYFQCGKCLDYQMQNSVIALCDKCEPANKRYDLVCITDSYAVVMDEKGVVYSRIELERIYDIKMIMIYGEED